MPPLTLTTALTTWQFTPLVSMPLAALAVAYLAGARAVTRRHRERPWHFPVRPAAWPDAARADGARYRRAWPAARTAAFLCGLAVIAVAAQGSPGGYDGELLQAHMVQHLLLIMVAPPLLVFGRPVTLLLHATRNPWHSRVKRIVRSRAATTLTWPPTAVAVYSAVVLGTHLTGLLAVRGAGHDAEHLCYLAAGYLFFLPVIGSEPVRWRVPLYGRYLMLLAAMPADIATGAILMLHGPVAGYGGAGVRAGGLIMLAGSELLMTGFAVVLAVGIVADRGRDTRRTPDLAAYNAHLASLDR